MGDTLNIVWEKCHHGVEKRSLIPCEECRKEKERFKSFISSKKNQFDTPTRIPIKRGCHARGGNCFCNGTCQDIIGYRDPLFPGEK